MSQICADCGAPFSMEAEEREWMGQHGRDNPVQCPRCRAFQDGIQDQSILCGECNRVFIYPRELRFYAELFGWGRPRRCLGGCTRGGTRERTDDERLMFDFLKRLRAAQRGASGGLSVTDLRRIPRPGGERTPAAPEDEGRILGGSLADALKEFQARKRRSPGR